jgi:hypothetical protein
MSKHTKRQRKWTLLFRYEGDIAVHLYEPLKKYELDSRLRHGWKVID